MESPKHPSNEITKANLNDVCWYHKPTQEQAGRHQSLSEALDRFLYFILDNCPPCADRDEAIKLARSSKMFASAAIALEPENA